MSGRYDNVNGTWCKVSKRYDNIGGTWDKTKKRYENVNGVWVPSYNDGYPATFGSTGTQYSGASVVDASTEENIAFSGSNIAARNPNPYQYGIIYTIKAPTDVAINADLLTMSGTYNSTCSGYSGEIRLTPYFDIIYPDGSRREFEGTDVNTGTFLNTMTFTKTVSNRMAITKGEAISFEFFCLASLDTSDSALYSQSISMWFPWNGIIWAPTGLHFYKA